MNDKTILISCDDLGLLGGSVITTIRMANYLVDHGWRVIMYTCNSNAVEELDPRVQIEFATWYFFLRFGKNVGKIGGLSFGRTRFLFKKYRVSVVLNSHIGILGLGISILSKIHGIPIFSLCSSQVENVLVGLPKILKNKVVKKFLEYGMYIYYSNMDVLLPQSEFSQKLLLDLGVTNKSFVISNGVDVNAYKKEGDELLLNYIKRKYLIDTDNFNLVFLGRLAKEKCIDTLIKAIKLISENNEKIHVYLIGNGPLKDILINLVREYNLTTKIHFLGHIPKIDLISVLSVCNLYVHPSEVELEGMALLEAMACGLPVLVSDSELSASKQFVRENGDTFIHADSLDLAQKIEYYFKNSLILNTLANKSHEIALEYSFESYMQKLNEILKNSVDEKD